MDQASGVSVRLTTSLLENVVSNAERRALHLKETRVAARLADVFAAHSAVTGKVELVFEGEREGPQAVADRILGEGVTAVFLRNFPKPYGDDRRRQDTEPEDVYKPIVDWFAAGNTVVVQDEGADDGAVLEVPTLKGLVKEHLAPADEDLPAGCELVLEGLHRASVLAKDRSADGVTYGDLLKRMFAGFEE